MLMPRRGRDRDTPAPGIRRHGAGWQTSVKVRGESSYASWPIDTLLSEMIEWQKDERAHLRTTLPATPSGSFAADARTYLARADVQAMPTYVERQQHIQEWVTVFREKRRRKITPDLIAAERDRLLASGYAAGSVNKRLRALSNLWKVLDGRRAPNPVLEVPECEEPDPEARGLPYALIETILAAIPETAIGVTKDGTRTTGKGIARPSKTKARLRVIAYTGLPHKILKALTRSSVRLSALDAHGNPTIGTVLVPARRKGKKHRRAHDRPLPQLLPLLPQAIAAFQEFDRLDCWGPFSNSSMWKAFQRACKTLKITGLRPYDFRHSLLTAVYDATHDLRVTGQLGGHRAERTTKRYTLAAVAPHVQAALDQLCDRLPTGLATENTEGVRNIGKNRQDAAHPEAVFSGEKGGK
jgi:integrase